MVAQAQCPTTVPVRDVAVSRQTETFVFSTASQQRQRLADFVVSMAMSELNSS